jgi:hypothetical protein
MSIRSIIVALLLLIVAASSGFYAWKLHETAQAEAAYFRNDRPACLDCGKEY